MALQAIALVGLSGTGKSSVGRVLAAHLHWRLIDTDQQIVMHSGMPISELFAQHGETHFRDLESAALQAALEQSQVVVATGGGAVLRPQNRQLLQTHAFVVWLDAATSALAGRLQTHDERRPLLAGDTVARLETLRAQRTPLYTEVARLRLDSAAQTPEGLAEAIIAAFTSHSG